jgi:hypothetical protein
MCAQWNVAMLARIRPSNALRTSCRTLLAAYESELLVYEEAQEFLDDVGLLGEIAGEYASADVYLERVFEACSALSTVMQ